MTTNGYFDVFCFIFGAIWCVFLAKTTCYVSKMQCFYEENQAIYTKCTNHLYQMHKLSNHRYKLFVSQVQALCIRSTKYLYRKYKPFVLLVRDYPNNRKGLSEQPQGTIGTTTKDYLLPLQYLLAVLDIDALTRVSDLLTMQVIVFVNFLLIIP